MCLAIWSNCDESINQLDCHCDQSINQFKFKSRVLGVVIFFQKRRKKISYCICKWKWPFRFANKTKWTSVKMSRTIGPIVPSGIQPFHCFKILLDKKKNVSYLEVFQQIVGFILQLICSKQFSVLIIAQIIYLVGGVPPSGGVTRKWRPPCAQKRHLLTS